jgi:hypothetical protein
VRMQGRYLGPRGRSLVRGVVGIPVVAMVLSSCLGVRYDYISHKTTGGGDTYLRIPQSWTVYSQSQIYGGQKSHVSSAQLNQIESVSWTDIFTPDGSRVFNPKLGFGSSRPVGVVDAVELTGTTRENFSLSSLRTLILPTDPLGSPSGGYHYKVTSYKEFTRSSGFRGSSMTVRITPPSGPVSVLTQDAVVDAGTNWVYFIGVGCVSSCFSAYQSSISAIVNSWNVKAEK